MIMAFCLHLLLLIFTLICCGEGYEDIVSKDYEKWISWNIQHFRYKERIENQNDVDGKYQGNKSLNQSSSFDGLDTKLIKAEENKLVILVSPQGDGNFSTIKEALSSVPVNNTRRTIIFIKPGIYREKLLIPKSKRFVTLMGNESRRPIITGNDTASTVGITGLPLKTFHSATVAINADYFVAYNIRFENTAPCPRKGSIGGQAVALRISGTKGAFYNCSFIGNQDTLYDHKGLHYFKDCFVQGSMDFIFGYGRSLYASCIVKSVATGVAAVTAQKRNERSLASGFSFLRCVVCGSGTVYLGRAWGDRSRVVFIYSHLGGIINPRGWDDWGVPSRHRTVYYGQYQCDGEGANTSSRVQWGRVLNDQEAKPFSSTDFIKGHKWLFGKPSLGSSLFADP